MPRLLIPIAFVLGAAVVLPQLASSQSTAPSKAQLHHPAAQGSAAERSISLTIRSVHAISEAHGSAVEINSTGSLLPTIRKLEAPSRLVIDLEAGLSTVVQRRIAVEREDIKSIRVNQSRRTPPMTRVVIDLESPRDYYWEMMENKLVVHLRPLPRLADDSGPLESSSSSSLSLSSESGSEAPALMASTREAGGTILLSANRLAAGSLISAGADTTVVNLPQGGKVHVCPGTSVSFTSANGRDLMLGMSTGTLEAHDQLSTATDSILTPDFRILLAGPGEFHYAVAVDSKGNTCVRALGSNTGGALISELMGGSSYQIRPNEQVVFRSGQLSQIDTTAGIECGCPRPQPNVMRAESSPGSPPPAEATSLVAGGMKSDPAASPAPLATAPRPHTMTAQVNVTSISALPRSKASDIHVEVEAPLVFRAVNPPLSRQETERLPITSVSRFEPAMIEVLPPPASVSRERATHKGFLGKVKRFLGTLFR